jgi:hypothetical protein
MSSTDEREAFKGKLEAASEWLFSSDSATLEEFKGKLTELTYFPDSVDNRDIEGPISRRKADYLARPEKVEMLQQILESTKAVLKASREILEPPKPKNNDDDLDDEIPMPTPSSSLFQLDDKSFQKLDSLTSEVETWLNDKLAIQAKLKDWEEPILLPSDLEKKSQDLQNMLRKILLEQSKPKPKSKTSSSKTSTGKASGETETATSSAAADSETGGPVYSDVEEDVETVTTTITSTIIEEPEPTAGEINHEEL